MIPNFGDIRAGHDKKIQGVISCYGCVVIHACPDELVGQGKFFVFNYAQGTISFMAVGVVCLKVINIFIEYSYINHLMESENTK